MKPRVLKKLCKALLLSALCMNLSSTRAYTDPYVPPQKIPAAGQEQFKIAKTFKVIATRYIKPNREDYASQRQFIEAVKLNGSGKITATGTIPRPEVTIAANLKFFKPGTLVRIKETGMVGRIEDTGSAMRRNPFHIDIFTKSKEAAENWGVRKVTLEILAKNS